MHASFFPQLEDLGGEVLVTPAQAAALELLEAMTGGEDDDDDECNESGRRADRERHAPVWLRRPRMVAPENALPGPPRPDPHPDTPLRARDPAEAARSPTACRPPSSAWAASGAPSACSGRRTASTRPPSATRAATRPTRPTRRPAPARPATPRPSWSCSTPRKITYEEILKLFWESHDPTQAHAPGQRRRHPVPLGDLHHHRPSRLAAVEATKAAFGERLKGAGYGEITTEIAAARTSSTTPRTTTSSTWRRCRTATAASAAPASAARSGSAPT